MDRRSFLRTLFGGAIAATFDPELLLWKPDTKKIFIPQSPVLFHHKLYEADIVMDLNDLTLQEEGVLDHWTMVYRDKQYARFVTNGKYEQFLRDFRGARAI